MTPMQAMALELLSVIEELLLEVEAREIVLRHLELEGDDYSALIEQARTSRAGKIRQVVEPLRAVIHQETASEPLPSDGLKMVQELLKSLELNDYWDA